jgi:hypothetical protein
MPYQLISRDDYDKLSADNTECFIELEQICRQNVQNLLERTDNQYVVRDLQLSYMSIVSNAAEECGIPNLGLPDNLEDYSYSSFVRDVDGQLTVLQLR